MTYRVAIARAGSLPTVFTGEYSTAADAAKVQDHFWRESLRGVLSDGCIPPRFENRPTGDYCVIPSDVASRPQLRSTEVRAAAVHTTAGRDWKDAFTDAEIAEWTVRREED